MTIRMSDQAALVKSNYRTTAAQLGPASICGLVDRFLASLDVAESSRATYARQVRQFVVWLIETRRIDALDSLNRQTILSYKRDLAASGKSSYTISGYLTAVRILFSWLEAEKVYPDVAGSVRGVKRAKGYRKDCLTPQQIRSVLQSIDTSTVLGLRDYALINLLTRTGLRTIEVSRAEVGDLRQESGQPVLWVQGKGRDAKDDFVIVVDDALVPLYAYLNRRKQLRADHPLFGSESDRNSGRPLSTRSISRIVKNALRASGLNSPRLTAHSLRHTAISLAIRNGARVEQAQAMARHSSIATTMVYAHNLRRVEEGAEHRVKF